MTETEKKWAERVREWKESGERAEEFAAGKPYKASTLRWWGTQVRRRGEEDDDGRGEMKWDSKPIRLARVVRRTRPGAAAEVERASGGGVVVEIAGARVMVTRGFDVELLSEVVRVLAGAR